MKHDDCCGSDEGMTLNVKIMQQPAQIRAPNVVAAPEGWDPMVYGHAEFVIPPSGEVLPLPQMPNAQVFQPPQS